MGRPLGRCLAGIRDDGGGIDVYRHTSTYRREIVNQITTPDGVSIQSPPDSSLFLARFPNLDHAFVLTEAQLLEVKNLEDQYIPRISEALFGSFFCYNNKTIIKKIPQLDGRPAYGSDDPNILEIIDGVTMETKRQVHLERNEKLLAYHVESERFITKQGSDDHSNTVVIRSSDGCSAVSRFSLNAWTADHCMLGAHMLFILTYTDRHDDSTDYKLIGFDLRSNGIFFQHPFTVPPHLSIELIPLHERRMLAVRYRGTVLIFK